MVVAVDRGRYTCLVGADCHPHRVVAMRARELRRHAIVVGDVVDLVGDTSGRRDTLARAVRIADRRTILRRSADDADPTERVVVANADALLVVVAAVDPPPRAGFIDRCLVAAATGGLAPLLLVTKMDLADPSRLADAYRALGVPVLTSGRDGARLADDGLARIREALAHRVTALIGQSGVGKSTLVNSLVPRADRATGPVTGVGKGRHTSTSAVALELPGGGWIVDTPGVRSFGLAHVGAGELLGAFVDLAPAAADCPPGCGHHSSGIGCALDAAAADNPAMRARLDSFRRLLVSRGDATGSR